METAATHTIDGNPVDGVEFFDVINPATASAFARAPDASRAQLDLAVKAARRAFERWRAVPAEGRREILFAFAAAIRAETQNLAQLLTREQGKPLAAAIREIESTAARIEGLLAFELTPETLRSDATRAGRARLPTAGRGGRDCSLELAGVAGRANCRAGAGDRQQRDPEAVAVHAARHSEIGRDCRQDLAAGPVQHAVRRQRARPLDDGTPGIDKIGFVGSVATGNACWRAPPRRISSGFRWSSAATMPPSCWPMPMSRPSRPNFSGARSSTAASAAWPSNECWCTSRCSTGSVRRWRGSRIRRKSVTASSRGWSWDRFRTVPSSSACWA